MHRLTVSVGWPILVLCAVLFVTAVPTLIAWARFEVRLARRARLRPSYKVREGWPYW